MNLFPVRVLAQGETLESLPEEGTYYVVAKNGVFLSELSGVIRSVTPVNTVPFLPELRPMAQLFVPPFPHHLAFLASVFFAEVFAKLRSECELQIYYAEDTEEFMLHCPEQVVSVASVHYRRESSVLPDFPRHRRIGTIHSHCDFNAFHSGTDTHDEETEDGLHITFGHVNSDRLSIVATISVRDNRFPLHPMDVIAGLVSHGNNRYDVPRIGDHDAVERQVDAWVSRCRKESHARPS